MRDSSTFSDKLSFDNSITSVKPTCGFYSTRWNSGRFPEYMSRWKFSATLSYHLPKSIFQSIFLIYVLLRLKNKNLIPEITRTEYSFSEVIRRFDQDQAHIIIIIQSCLNIIPFQRKLIFYWHTILNLFAWLKWLLINYTDYRDMLLRPLRFSWQSNVDSICESSKSNRLDQVIRDSPVPESICERESNGRLLSNKRRGNYFYYFVRNIA